MKICSKCKHNKPNKDFNKKSETKDGLDYWCRSCKSSYKQSVPRYEHKEGHCVYIATYPTGTYIGSGSTVDRRRKHTQGLVPHLEGTAVSFTVLLYGSRGYCKQIERALIQERGLDTLLNTRVP